MKYVIKAVNTVLDTPWYATSTSADEINWALNLTYAQKFDSVEEAVTALVRRAVRTYDPFWCAMFNLAIVGIERNEPQPLYREVEL